MTWKDSVTNNTRIGEVWKMNIKGKKEAFQKDKMTIKYIIEESTILKISHIQMEMKPSEEIKTDLTPAL